MNEKIRIRLKAYDHRVLDRSVRLSKPSGAPADAWPDRFLYPRESRDSRLIDPRMLTRNREINSKFARTNDSSIFSNRRSRPSMRWVNSISPPVWTWKSSFNNGEKKR